MSPKLLVTSSLRVSFVAEIENAIARTDLVEERQASVWGGVLGTLSSTGNVWRTAECASRAQVRVQAGFTDLSVSAHTISKTMSLRAVTGE